MAGSLKVGTQQAYFQTRSQLPPFFLPMNPHLGLASSHGGMMRSASVCSQHKASSPDIPRHCESQGPKPEGYTMSTATVDSNLYVSYII